MACFVKLHRYFILKIMHTTAGMSPSILFLVAGVNSTHFLRVKLLRTWPITYVNTRIIIHV